MTDKKKAKKRPEPLQPPNRPKRVPVEELDKQIAAAEEKLREIAQMKCDIRSPEPLPNDPSYTLFFHCGQDGEEMSLLLIQGSGTLLLSEAPRYLKEGAVRQMSAFLEYAESAVGDESRDDSEPEPYTGDDPEEFAAAQRISDDLELAQKIAKECFIGFEQLELQLQGDPESSARWVAIRIGVTGSVGDVVSQHSTYCRRISTELSERGLDQLRLQYHVV